MERLNVLADVTHPSLAKFFGEVCRDLEGHGHRTVIASRRKDRTTDLLNRDGLRHTVASRTFDRGMVGLATELVVRVVRLVRLIRRHDIDIVLTRSPAGCIAGRIAGAKVMFDTDDGRGAGIHHSLAAPLAHVITSPEWLADDFGARHQRYRSLKSFAYLHPVRFTPDPHVTRLFGVPDGQPIFILRRSAYSASHDAGHGGVDDALARAVVKQLSAAGFVVISSEEDRDDDLATTDTLDRHPELLHQLIAASSLVVTDGASVAEEAVVLGAFALFVSDFAWKRGYLNSLEESYGALEQYTPAQGDQVLERIDSILVGLPQVGAQAASTKERLLSDQDDLVAWYREFIEKWAATELRLTDE